MPPQNLKGTVALVTGASRGLGRAFALDLAKQGAAVGMLARNAGELADAVAEAQASGGQALAVPADVTDMASVERSVLAVSRTFGPVNLLVNAAGACTQAIGETWKLDISDWWRIFEVNIKGSQICFNAVVPGMIEAQRGRIIHVASSTVMHNRPRMSAYVASKTALIKLSELEAEELRPYGLAVFAVHPGTVRTEMSGGLIASGMFDWLKDIFDQGMDDTMAQGCDLISYLASGKADDLSGCFFPVPLSPEILVQHAPDILKKHLQVLSLNLLPEAQRALTRPAPSLGA